MSLNEADEDSYETLCKPAFGKAAFGALQDFARGCKKNGIDVWFSVVDCIGGQKIAKCRKIAESCGVPLRVREMITDS